MARTRNASTTRNAPRRSTRKPSTLTKVADHVLVAAARVQRAVSDRASRLADAASAALGNARATVERAAGRAQSAAEDLVADARRTVRGAQRSVEQQAASARRRRRRPAPARARRRAKPRGRWQRRWRERNVWMLARGVSWLRMGGGMIRHPRRGQ